MNLLSRTITGVILIVFGVIMTAWGMIVFVTLPYGIAAIVIGIVILLNKNEDKIERIKKQKGGNSK